MPPGTPSRPFVVQRGRLADNAYKFDIVRTHTHVGTHVEAPAHFYLGGKYPTQLPLEAYYGRGILLDVRDASKAQRIDGDYLAAEIGDIIQAGDIVLCRTSDRSAAQWPCFAPEAALWLRDRKIKMLGIGEDFRLGSTITASRGFHDILMSRDITLIEFLDNLADLRRREFFFIALPFKVAAIDSAPVRRHRHRRTIGAELPAKDAKRTRREAGRGEEVRQDD